MKKIITTSLCLIFVFTSFAQDTRQDLRKKSPNRVILRLGSGLFANYTYDLDPSNENFLKGKTFKMDNITYSGMIGLRSGFNTDNYRFSSTGRDKMRGNVVGLFYQTGTLNNVGLGDLEKADKKIFINSLDESVQFSELQVGVVWREFLRISGGKGTVKSVKSAGEILDNVDYQILTAGLNLRFGRLSPTINYSIISADGFETAMSRWDIQICMNIYFWKKILHKDKHLITN